MQSRRLKRRAVPLSVISLLLPILATCWLVRELASEEEQRQRAAPAPGPLASIPPGEGVQLRPSGKPGPEFPDELQIGRLASDPKLDPAEARHVVGDTSNSTGARYVALRRLYEGRGRMNAWKAALAAVNGGLAEHQYPFMKRRPRRKDRDEPFVAPLPIVTNSETLYYGFQVHTQGKASIWLTHTVNGNQVAAELVYTRPLSVPGVAAIVTAVGTYQGVPLPLSPSPESGAAPYDEDLHSPIPLGLAHFQTQGADRSFVAQFTLRSDQIPPRASSPRLELHRGPIRGPGTMILAFPLDPELMRRPPSAARLVDPIVADNVRFDDFVFYVSDVPFPGR